MIKHIFRILVFIILNLIQFNKAHDYTGYKLFRIPAEENTMLWLENLENSTYLFNKKTREETPLIDIWSMPKKNKPHMDILVSPEFTNTFISLLKSHRIDQIQILQDNIQNVINSQKYERMRRVKRRVKILDQQNNEINLNTYNRYDKMVDYMINLQKQNPTLVEILNITKTFENRDLVGIKLGKKGFVKPAIFIDAGMHAREWIAPATALHLMHQMVNEYKTDRVIDEILSTFDLYIIPVANPDGYEYSMTKDRLWRKTRSKNITVNKWCIGVDVNRNWGYRWGEAGANRSPCSNIYAGSGPFSEKETIGLKNFINWKISDLKAYISLHSYGQMFLSPWGYTEEKPENYQEQIDAAKLAVEAIFNSTGAKYNYGTISELMYPASGTSLDYMQDRGVPYIYGIELRPDDMDDLHGFALPAEFIKLTGKDLLAALKQIALYIKKKNLQPSNSS